MSDSFRFEVSLSVLNHLGRNLYRNFVTVLGEAISNSWDADAKNVWIEIDRETSSFSIKDDGVGMSAEDFQEKFLKIGYSKRKDGNTRSPGKRPYIGAKGIGMLALLSCSKRISVFSKKLGEIYVGGMIDNADLDHAIQGNKSTEEYSLEALDWSLIDDMKSGHDHGTIICFEESNERIQNSIDYIKQLLALSFKFSVLDSNFTIHVNGDSVTVDDLKPLSDATQFLWTINNYTDDFVNILSSLERESTKVSTEVDIKGFVGSVKKPANLKVRGTDVRATIDLFVNGRLREKNIIRHIPTQRIVESYIYGQIHFDSLDREGVDPFTSSREGVVEDDEKFQNLMTHMKIILSKIIDDWDKFRLELYEEGDDENQRKTLKERKSTALIKEAIDEYKPKGRSKNDNVYSWINELISDAEYNLPAYVDCFISENLLRKYISHKKIILKPNIQKKVDQFKCKEKDFKAKANISFPIRNAPSDLSYIDMDDLALTVEGKKSNADLSLCSDAVSYKPIRNAIGHTGSLTQTAKNHLNTTLENIKARINLLLSK